MLYRCPATFVALLLIAAVLACQRPGGQHELMSSPDAKPDSVSTAILASAAYEALELAGWLQATPRPPVCLTRASLYANEPPAVMRAQPGESVLSALRKRGVEVYGITDCQVRAYWGQASLRSDNRPAWMVWVGPLQREGDQAILDLGYHRGFLSGTGYSCRLLVASTDWDTWTCTTVGVE